MSIGFWLIIVPVTVTLTISAFVFAYWMLVPEMAKSEAKWCEKKG